MTCRNPRCTAAIPDESAFCDQCGTRQAAPGAIINQPAAAKAKPPSAVVEPNNPAKLSIAADPSPPLREDAATAFAQRPIRLMDPAELRVRLTDGTEVGLAKGDVLGQAEGPLVAYWAEAGLVSGRHGQVDQQAGQWTYTDLFSVNGSTLNGHFVRPGKPVALQSGDKLVLGNRGCTIL